MSDIDDDGDDLTARILSAAFALFAEHGYAATSTLEIATRAKVSKRDLYARFGSKEAIMLAGITRWAERMRPVTPAATPKSRRGLSAALRAFGSSALQAICDPRAITVFRLAIAEAVRSPEVAKVLDAEGRQAIRKALEGFLAAAQVARLIPRGDAAALAGQFLSLVLGDLMLTLLLGVRHPPSDEEIETRVRRATRVFHGRARQRARYVTRRAPGVSAAFASADPSASCCG